MWDSIGIIGSGRMGSQLVIELLLFNKNVYLYVSKKYNTALLMEDYRKKMEKRKVMTCELAQLNNLKIVTELSDLSNCGLIIEAITEKEDSKYILMKELSEVLSENTVMATNTSSISVTDFADHYKYPGQVIGLHFFNPVKNMKLVEVVKTKYTSPTLIKNAIKFVYSLDKIPVCVKDSVGFIVNRLLLGQINDAINLYDQGIADVQEIDSAIKLGLNHPMGPFELADYIGLDVCQAILLQLYKSTGEKRYIPAKSLYDKNNNHEYGRKTGKGYYDYTKE